MDMFLLSQKFQVNKPFQETHGNGSTYKCETTHVLIVRKPFQATNDCTNKLKATHMQSL